MIFVDIYIYSNSRARYERKLKQAEKAGKHHKAKKYAEKLERLRAEAAEQSTDSDTDSDDDIDSDDDMTMLAKNPSEWSRRGGSNA